MTDSVKIYVKAGDGGKGCSSFKGVKFTRSWRPDGGNAGNGADVVIRVDKNKQSLEHLRFKQHFRAEKGKTGQANKKKGADRRPCIINVPPGTLVYDLRNNLLLRDLIEPNEELLVAKAGVGGKANTRTKPATSGLSGEERHLSLQLKLIADISIVGYPNSGKSTFLSHISSARAKIASYPFTTISPFLGVLEFSDFAEPHNLTLVEIPALIKGSHQGKGLGAQFLRHAERSKVLVHLIDMAAQAPLDSKPRGITDIQRGKHPTGQEGRGPVCDYYNLNHELELYSAYFAKKKQILVANKMDLPQAKANLSNFLSKVKKETYPISCVTGEGIEELLNHLRSHFQQHKG